MTVPPPQTINNARSIPPQVSKQIINTIQNKPQSVPVKDQKKIDLPHPSQVGKNQTIARKISPPLPVIQQVP